MKVLVGECTGTMADRIQALGWGRMWIARGRNIYAYLGEPWGLDNGAFRDWREGVPFNGDAFLRSVDKALNEYEPPYLAVCPDIVGGGLESLDFSLGWLDRLPDHFPWYLAVQDGLAPADVEPHIHQFAGLFLGGTLAFKATAPTWRELATEHDKRFHYGRCGTLGRVRQAIHHGADSLDSAFPMWTRSRWNLFVDAINGFGQSDLFLKGDAA